jgi:small subunit ribosomal protein S2
LVIVTDPNADRQALKEAASMGVPVLALVDTDNSISDIDFIIPVNNKGRRSLATVYWLLARQVLREKGEISPEEDLQVSIDEFETKPVETPQYQSEEE